MKNLLKGSAIVGSVLPFLAFAQTDATSILFTIATFIANLIPVLITAALAYFIYGVVRFVIAGDADKKAEARQIVIQGIIGLFVIVSVWGLVGVIQNTFQIGTGGVITGDQLPGVQF